MRHIIGLGVVLPCLLVVRSAMADPPGAVVDRGVDHGRYISHAADCVSCHTAPGGRPFAGGAALDTPFGKIFPPNITPDRGTGIGDWSREDFARAVREGVRKDGALLYPAMPYTNYTKMSDADIDALWRYMRSIRPAAHQVPDNTFSFPFNIRRGIAVWQGLYFQPGRFVAAADKSTNWNRGAYLVEALGHCGACHTPRNVAQATQPQHRLTGAQIEGWYAPDIGNDPLSSLNSWDIGQLAAFLQTGRMPGNVKAFGPMQEVIHDSLRFLTDADLYAIAVYLKDQSSFATARTAARVIMPRERLAAGKSSYEEHCANCHLSDGRGQEGTVPALAGNSAVAAAEPYNVIMAMLYGFEPQGTWAAMASFASALNDDQISDIANYVRTAWGNSAPPNASPWMVGDWRERQRSAPPDAHRALVCPILAENVMQPALSQGPDAWKQAARDQDKLRHLVGAYIAARPQASPAQIIEAMTTAYCRAIAAGGASQAITDSHIAEFSQQVAVVLARGSS
jgi:mono/diheme cytochrome c family protein